MKLSKQQIENILSVAGNKRKDLLLLYNAIESYPWVLYFQFDFNWSYRNKFKIVRRVNFLCIQKGPIIITVGMPWQKDFMHKKAFENGDLDFMRYTNESNLTVPFSFLIGKYPKGS